MHATGLGKLYDSGAFPINQVLLCPSVKENLLSVSKLAAQGLDTIFSKGKVILGYSGSMDTVLLQGMQQGSSYFVEYNASPSSALVTSTSNNMHLKFNHLISRIFNFSMTNTGLAPLDYNDFSCEACLIGKARQDTPPSSSSSRSSEIGHCVHSDLCKPIKPISHTGIQYVLTLTDDFSRYIFAFLLRSKLELPARFQE
jgi:histone deacetylase 1/2